MRLLLTLFIFFVPLVTLAQTNVLSGFKNGSWALLDTNGNVLTKTEYHYIHTFDQKGTSYFMQNGVYGIIDASGKEKIGAEYSDIVQHGFGIYTVQKNENWSLIRVDNKVELLIDSLFDVPTVLGANWIILSDSTEATLVNLQSGKQFLKDSNSYFILNSGEYLGMGNNSQIRLFSPAGDELKSTVGEMYRYSDRYLVIIDTNEQRTIVDENGIWNLPYTVTSFSIWQNELYVGNNDFGTLYEPATKKILFQGPYSDIYTYNSEYYAVEGKAGANLINKKTKKALLPPNLSYYYESDSSFFVYRPNRTCALLDLNGKFIIPGYYDYIEQKGQLFHLSLNANIGLYSLKKNGFVLPMIYYSITNQANNRYKALTDEAFSIVELDENHNIKRRIDGSNNVNVRTAKSSIRKKYFDPRLFPLGWYVDSTEVEEKGEMKKRYLWGLKDENDSITMKPKYPDLKYISGPFSLQVNPPKKITKTNGEVQIRPTYEFVSWENGRKVPNLVCVYVDSNDFINQTWTKFSTVNSGGIIDAEGKIRYMTYLSGVSIPFTRYCEADGWEASPTVRDTSFYQTTEDYQMFEYVTNSNRFVAKNGRWNFIQPDGSDLFKESFQFVEEFVGSTAIAKRNGKWGVVTKDTILLPFKFNKISRRIIGKDTLFYTDESPESARYLTEQLQDIKEYRNVIVKSPNLLLVDNKGVQQLINEQKEVLAENVKSMKALPSGYYKAKIEKETHILDPDGMSVAITTFDVIDVLNDRYLLIEKNNRLGLAEFDNTVVLEEKNSELSSIGRYILAKSDMYYLYNVNLQLVRKSENQLFVDPMQNTVSVIKKNTLTVYRENLKLAKLKNVIPTRVWNHLIWITQKEKTFGIDFQGDTIVKTNAIELFETLPNDWQALKQEKGVWEFYGKDWQKEVVPIQSRKIKYLEPGFLCFLTKKNKWLIWDITNHNSIEVDEVLGEFESEFCLVKNGRKLFYINKQLKAVNNLRYSNASSFHNGVAAVCDSRGGTLVDTQFKPLTYPSYVGLTYLGANIYKANPQVVHNLYRLDGTTVLPKNVEKLNIVNNRFIQTIDKGEVHYTRLNGISMF